MMKIGVGYENQQFQGSVANVQVFKEGNVRDISAMPCKLRQSSILPWHPDNWKVTGSDWYLIEEFEEIFCVLSDHYNLAIPFGLTLNGSLTICKEQMNNSTSLNINCCKTTSDKVGVNIIFSKGKSQLI